MDRSSNDLDNLNELLNVGTTLDDNVECLEKAKDLIAGHEVDNNKTLNEILTAKTLDCNCKCLEKASVSVKEHDIDGTGISNELLSLENTLDDNLKCLEKAKDLITKHNTNIDRASNESVDMLKLAETLCDFNAHLDNTNQFYTEVIRKAIVDVLGQESMDNSDKNEIIKEDDPFDKIVRQEVTDKEINKVDQKVSETILGEADVLSEAEKEIEVSAEKLDLPIGEGDFQNAVNCSFTKCKIGDDGENSIELTNSTKISKTKPIENITASFLLKNSTLNSNNSTTQSNDRLQIRFSINYDPDVPENIEVGCFQDENVNPSPASDKNTDDEARKSQLMPSIQNIIATNFFSD